MAFSAIEVDGYEELTEVTAFWMFDTAGTLTESSKFMWVQLDVAGWFRILSASDIWRWWPKDVDLYTLKLWTDVFVAAQLHYVVYGKIGVKQSTDAGFRHGVVWQLYFSWLEASSRNRVRQKLTQLICIQWRTHIPDLAISSSVSATLPSITEPLVSSIHLACVSRTLCRVSQGIWHHL